MAMAVRQGCRQAVMLSRMSGAPGAAGAPGPEFVGRMYIRELFASLARRSGWHAAEDGSG